MDDQHKVASFTCQDFLNALSQASAVPVFVKDLEGRYLLVNQHLAGLWGLSANEVLGKTDRELLPESMAATLRENDQKVITRGEPIQIEEEVEFDGKKRLYLTSKTPLRDGTGTVRGVCGIAIDITDMRRAEIALRESEARFRTLADSAPVLIWMSGKKKEGVFFNRTWLAYTGRPLEQELGDGWLQGVHPEDIEALGACQRGFETRTRFQTRFRMRRFDGEYRWMLDTGVPRWTDDGMFCGFVGSCTEITDQIRLEQTLRQRASALASSHERKDEFLAMLGHELRNPLSPIRHAVTLLQARQKELPKDLETCVAIADRQITHLTRLVDDLLDVARVNQGRIELKPRPLTIAQVLEVARDAVRPAFDDAGTSLAIAEPPPSATINADETRLTQAMVNLLNNALKFSPPGSTVRVESLVNGQEVEIRVIDQGQGIPADNLPHLFDLFFRHAGVSTSGLGVGLALVRRIVELHGGAITCHSEGEGRGSTFILRLPKAEKSTR